MNCYLPVFYPLVFLPILSTTLCLPFPALHSEFLLMSSFHFCLFFLLSVYRIKQVYVHSRGTILWGLLLADLMGVWDFWVLISMWSDLVEKPAQKLFLYGKFSLMSTCANSKANFQSISGNFGSRNHLKCPWMAIQ